MPARRESTPRLVGALATGDKDYGKATPSTDATRRFTPFDSLHVGVVSTNMGAMDEPIRAGGRAVASCLGLGSDGVLQASTEIARTGVVALTPSEFQGYAQGQTVLAPDPTCSAGAQPAYQTYRAGEQAHEAVSEALRCVAIRGVRGCPFESQLEAMWKALAPHGDDALHTFLNQTKGQGDRWRGPTCSFSPIQPSPSSPSRAASCPRRRGVRRQSAPFRLAAFSSSRAPSERTQ